MGGISPRTLLSARRATLARRAPVWAFLSKRVGSQNWRREPAAGSRVHVIGVLEGGGVDEQDVDGGGGLLRGHHPVLDLAVVGAWRAGFPIEVHEMVARAVCAVPGLMAVRSSNVLRMVAGLEEAECGFHLDVFRADYSSILLIDRKAQNFSRWRTGTDF